MQIYFAPLEGITGYVLQPKEKVPVFWKIQIRWNVFLMLFLNVQIPSYDIFEKYMGETKHLLCYNGDINSLEELNSLNDKWERCDKFLKFHNELLMGYSEYLSGDRNILFRMKELWTWWGVQFPSQEKILKQIKKTNSLVEYQMLVKSLIK